jgi:hypothetical protein
MTLFTANLAHIQQQPQSANRTELEIKFKQEKEEMDRQLLSAAQQILQQRLVRLLFNCCFCFSAFSSIPVIQ